MAVCRALKSTRSAPLQTGRGAWARPSLRPPKSKPAPGFQASEGLDHETVGSAALGHPFVVICHGSHRSHSCAVGSGPCAGRNSKSWLRDDLDAMLRPPVPGNLGRKGPVGTDKRPEAPPLIQARPVQLPAWCCLGKDRRVFLSILQLTANSVRISSQLFPT